MKIGVIHATSVAVNPLMKYFEKLYPDIEILNFVDEALLKYADQNGNVSPKGLRRFENMVSMAVEAEVDGILIACSVYCQFESVFKKFVEIPLSAIDGPMIHGALEKGGKIGILATTPAALPVTEKQIRMSGGEEMEVTGAVVSGAMEKLKKGDVSAHDKLIIEKIEELLKECGCVVLCQLSMARVKESLKPDIADKVFTSPETGIENLVKLITEKKAGRK